MRSSDAHPSRGSAAAQVTVDRNTPAPGAYAIVNTDPPQLFLAEDAAVISRLIALKVVAREHPGRFGPGGAEAVRDALLEERWADAVLLWMSATDTTIDIYAEYVPVWTDADLDAEVTSLEIRMARLFGTSHERSDAPASRAS